MCITCSECVTDVYLGVKTHLCYVHTRPCTSAQKTSSKVHVTLTSGRAQVFQPPLPSSQYTPGQFTDHGKRVLLPNIDSSTECTSRVASLRALTTLAKVRAALQWPLAYL